MPTPHWRAGIDRRTLIKTGATLAVAQFASPFVIRARAADMVKLGLDNPLTGTYAVPGKNEMIGCQMAIDEINAKGGILGRQATLVVEDFDQWRRRPGGAEGAQAHRQRQGRLPARQRELGACARHGPGLERKGRAAHRARRPHRRDHRCELPLERVPGLQHDANGGERRRWPRWSRTTARSTTTSRPTMPSVTPWSPAWSRRSLLWAARESAATSRRSARSISHPISSRRRRRTPTSLSFSSRATTC